MTFLSDVEAGETQQEWRLFWLRGVCATDIRSGVERPTPLAVR